MNQLANNEQISIPLGFFNNLNTNFQQKAAINLSQSAISSWKADKIGKACATFGNLVQDI